MIPHGARGRSRRRRHRGEAQPAVAAVLTWGLLGPGKGIEWAIDAIALLAGPRAAPAYTVAGQTHPKVLARDGEAYREPLQRAGRARSGWRIWSRFDDRYLRRRALAGLIGAAPTSCCCPTTRASR